MLSKALALEQFNANFTSLGTSWSPIPNFCLPKELVCMQVTYFMWKPIMIIIGWTKTYKAIPKSWKVYMHSAYMLPPNMSNVLSSWTSNFGRRPLERGWRWVGWPPCRAHSTDRKDICSLRDHHHYHFDKRRCCIDHGTDNGNVDGVVGNFWATYDNAVFYMNHQKVFT